jgi:hypothetical protein
MPSEPVSIADVLELKVGELGRMHLADHLAPQAAGLQDVGLVHARHP